MSKLHKALESLRPVKYSDVPVDNLPEYLRNAFHEAELIVNSVPPVPGGDAYEDACRAQVAVNGATKASEVVSSLVRPPPASNDMQELAKGWGKPMKLGAKENPMGVSVFKMSGHDKHGAWFARRSVHEGLGFSKWKRAMQMEFPQSLEVQDGPGGGSVRGIGGDRRLERHDAENVGRLEVYELSAKFPPPTSPRDFVTLLLTSDSALGSSSAIASDHGQGPKVVPRHWVVVSIPVDHPDAPPRTGLVRGQYESVEIIREIPLARARSQSTADLLDHSNHHASTRARGSTIGFAESRGAGAKGEMPDGHIQDDDPELNPVEWIMVTRSDPGGGIPRFLVDRGTPPSIAGDTVKFLDWACALEDLPPEETESIKEVPYKEETQRFPQDRRLSYSSMHQRIVAGVHNPDDDAVVEAHTPEKHSIAGIHRQEEPPDARPRKSSEYVVTGAHKPKKHTVAHVHKQEKTGIFSDDSTESLPIGPERLRPNGAISSVTHALGESVQAIGQGVGRYTPDIIQQQLPGVFPRDTTDDDEDDESSSDSSIPSSPDSFASAEPYYTAEPEPRDRDPTPVGSRIDLARVGSSDYSEKSVDSSSSKLDEKVSSAGSSTEKALAKIDAKKQHLDEKLAASREKQEREAQKAMARSEEEAEKQRHRHERDMRKRQERHDREMRKLEERAQKEARKIEARKKKEMDKDTLQRTQRDRDELKQRLDVLEEENRVLREQMGELQRENTLLVARFGRLDHGTNALKQVWDELTEENRRASREGSVGSAGSGGSNSNGRFRGKTLDRDDLTKSSESFA